MASITQYTHSGFLLEKPSSTVALFHGKIVDIRAIHFQMDRNIFCSSCWGRNVCYMRSMRFFQCKTCSSVLMRSWHIVVNERKHAVEWERFMKKLNFLLKMSSLVDRISWIHFLWNAIEEQNDILYIHSQTIES